MNSRLVGLGEPKPNMSTTSQACSVIHQTPPQGFSLREDHNIYMVQIIFTKGYRLYQNRRTCTEQLKTLTCTSLIIA